MLKPSSQRTACAAALTRIHAANRSCLPKKAFVFLGGTCVNVQRSTHFLTALNLVIMGQTTLDGKGSPFGQRGRVTSHESLSNMISNQRWIMAGVVGIMKMHVVRNVPMHALL
jgi:hypothetical protein